MFKIVQTASCFSKNRNFELKILLLGIRSLFLLLFINHNIYQLLPLAAERLFFFFFTVGGERPEPDEVGRVLELEQGLGVIREPTLQRSERPREGAESVGAK